MPPRIFNLSFNLFKQHKFHNYKGPLFCTNPWPWTSKLSSFNLLPCYSSSKNFSIATASPAVSPEINQYYGSNPVAVERLNEILCSRKLLKDLPEKYAHTFANYDEILEPNKVKGFKPQIQQLYEKIQSSVDQPLSDESYEGVIAGIVDIVGQVNDDELRALIYMVSLIKPTLNVRDPQFVKYWSSLDEECVKRMGTWDLNTMFQIEDIWFASRMSRVTNYNWTLVKRLFRKVDKISLEGYIRFMNILNITRKINSSISTYDLEYNLARHVDQLTHQEAVNVAMAFFKTETPIRDKGLVGKLLMTVEGKASKIHHIGIAALSKAARLSSNFSIADTLIRFQTEMIPEIHRLSPTSCTQLAIAGTRAVVFHREIIEKSVEKIQSNLEECRIKDFERMLLAITMFDQNYDDFIRAVLEEMKRVERRREIEEYGKSLTGILYYASFRGIYDYELNNIALDSAHVKKTYGRDAFRFQRELVCLDLSLDIECPDYKGSKLSPKVQVYILKKHTFYLAPPTKERVIEYESNLRANVEILTNILGDPDLVFACNILPQFHTAEIIICTDANNKVIKVPKEFRNIEPYLVKWIPKGPEFENIKFRALLNCSRSAYIYNTRNLTGNIKLQMRQLTKLGYHVDLIPCEIPGGKGGREAFLRTLLNKKGKNV